MIKICSLCNLKGNEDMVHFLGLCPILSDARVRMLSLNELKRDQYLDVLNGEWVVGWTALYGNLITKLTIPYRLLIFTTVFDLGQME